MELVITSPNVDCSVSALQVLKVHKSRRLLRAFYTRKKPVNLALLGIM